MPYFRYCQQSYVPAMNQTINNPVTGDEPIPDNESLHRDCLIAVVTNDADLKRFSEQRWYRIPERAIGRSLKVDSFDQFRKLALYQTSLVSNGLPSSIELWGEIDEVLRMSRREILPEE